MIPFRLATRTSRQIVRDLRTAARRRHRPMGVLTGDCNFGNCPICERETLFIKEDAWLRDNYRCIWCRSIPRQRALIRVLNQCFPNWRALRIHESSPGGESSKYIARQCPGYLPTQFFRSIPSGQLKNGVRCENLERLTFPDASFDLVITQDVLEHIFDAASVFREIARTLKPGGAHIFTVPWYHWKPTLVRAVIENGKTKLLEPPDFHANPIDPEGSLVVREWGPDLPHFIFEHSGMLTEVFDRKDTSAGIDAEFLEVFVSRKSQA